MQNERMGLRQGQGYGFGALTRCRRPATTRLRRLVKWAKEGRRSVAAETYPARTPRFLVGPSSGREILGPAVHGTRRSTTSTEPVMMMIASTPGSRSSFTALSPPAHCVSPSHILFPSPAMAFRLRHALSRAAARPISPAVRPPQVRLFSASTRRRSDALMVVCTPFAVTHAVATPSRSPKTPRAAPPRLSTGAIAPPAHAPRRGAQCRCTASPRCESPRCTMRPRPLTRVPRRRPPR